MKLVDFSDLVTSKAEDEEKFWDWLDNQLAEVHEEHKDKDAAIRVKSVNL